jgi:hypothetical protein
MPVAQSRLGSWDAPAGLRGSTLRCRTRCTETAVASPKLLNDQLGELGRSLVLQRNAYDPAQRLNALAGDRRIDLGPDCLGGLVAELFRGKRLNLL